MNKLTLRKYQQETIDVIEAQIMFGSDNLILKAETSFGKSAIIAKTTELYQNDGVLILVNIEPLLEQIQDFLDMLSIDYSVLKAGKDHLFDPSKKVQLVMAQTLHARIDKVNFEHNFFLYQQDEGHIEYDTKRTNAILDKIKPNIKLRYSASPYSQDGFALKDAEIIETASCNDLTDQGYLSPINYYIPKWAETVDYSKVKKSGAEYSMNSLDEIIGSDLHINQIVQSMNQLDAQNKKTIVFCSTIEMCDKMTNALLKANYSVSAYHSKISAKENERILKSFKHNIPYAGSDTELENQTLFTEEETEENIIKCIVSVSKLTTGFSVNDIDLGVIIRPSKVRNLYIQMTGRIRRISNSLDDVLKKIKDNNERN